MNNKLSKKRIIEFILIVIIIGTFTIVFLERENLRFEYPKTDKTSIRGIYINDMPMWVDVADSVKEIKTGLSGRTTLEIGQGMLFIFDKLDFYGMWMKDMNFPIDIIWINENLQIIDIKTQVLQKSYSEIFYPVQKALYVIEVNAGFSELNNIKIGDKVILQIF
ncbi:hypothetical protein A2Z61_00480 [Candidatus Campbellbacteria bacterium RIFCSPLOWO2_02_35_12]|uniref:DUF192 domain-containing protein n=1 Tax=Candidatus Campbellbacteria bacterium RIFCSPLOWO2_02_35_12 TaxID=1797580 RepID=A0A1F5EHM6_9BACT|nr:MAG: hypothetical protein A2Z61_00480 [Candidatus Campbellbacteria bacterium RIFCSPLOWO2_02_35_12]